MQSITEEIKETIKATVARFTEPTIGNDDPKYLCFCACFPLLLFLKTNKIDCSLTGGDYQGIRHFWLTLKGYDDTIIDPTIQQFKPHVEPIYIGPKTSAYTPDSNPLNEAFFWAYKFWAEPILDRPRSQGVKPKWLEERSNFYNVQFATILHQEIAQKNPETISRHQNRYCQLYFGTILKFLKIKTQTDPAYIENLRATLPPSFEHLLKNVQMRK